MSPATGSSAETLKRTSDAALPGRNRPFHAIAPAPKARKAEHIGGRDSIRQVVEQVFFRLQLVRRVVAVNQYDADGPVFGVRANHFQGAGHALIESRSFLILERKRKLEEAAILVEIPAPEAAHTGSW